MEVKYEKCACCNKIKDDDFSGVIFSEEVSICKECLHKGVQALNQLEWSTSIKKLPIDTRVSIDLSRALKSVNSGQFYAKTKERKLKRIPIAS